MDCWTFINRKLIPLYFWFSLYCFLFNVTNNILICSFLNDYLFSSDENILVILSLFLLYYVFKNFLNKFKTTTSLRLNILQEILSVSYKFIIFKNISLMNMLNFNLVKFNSFINFIINYYTYSYLNNTFVFLVNTFITNNIKWYTIFKTHSIYGYYRSTRLNFIDLKSENMIKSKY